MHHKMHDLMYKNLPSDGFLLNDHPLLSFTLKVKITKNFYWKDPKLGHPKNTLQIQSQLSRAIFEWAKFWILSLENPFEFIFTWMSRKSSAITVGPLSMGFPDPLKIRPSMSSETGVRKMSPVNSQVVFLASIPDVPSKTWNVFVL